MSDLEQEVQAQRRAWYEINTLPEDWTKLKWELEVDEDLPDYTDGIPDGYPCWDTVRDGRTGRNSETYCLTTSAVSLLTSRPQGLRRYLSSTAYGKRCPCGIA